MRAHEVTNKANETGAGKAHGTQIVPWLLPHSALCVQPSAYCGSGRWMTPDPLGGDITNPQSLNRYAYVLNNPTTFTDPSGLGPQDCSDPNYFFSHAECGGTPGCVAEGSEGCIPYHLASSAA